jgi:hypothetical protein
MTFDSVYEMTNPLTTVRKQHFWEYFSGSKLPMPSSVYSQTTENDHIQIAQSPSSGDSRAGQKITSASNGMVGNTLNELTVKLSNPYSTTAGYNVFAVVWDSSGSVRSTSDTISINSITNSPTWTDYTFSFSSPVTVNNGDVVGVTSDGGTTNSSSVTVKVNTSNVDSTGTFYAYRNGAWWTTHFGSNADMYLTATTGSNARWTLEQAIGSGNTGAMVDDVDGGYAITPAGVLDAGAITFNDKRQYSYNSSVCIAVCNKIDVGGRYRVGLSEDETLATTYNDTAHCFDGASGNIYLQTANGTAGNDTASDVTANTTTVHGIKIETKSSSVELSIDGVLKVTNTTYLPLTKLQPVFLARGGGGSGNQKSAIRYMECYNT